MERVGKLLTKSKTILDSTNDNRFFEGFLTVEMKDKQGEITIVDELYKVLPLWMDRGAPITDTHSNRVVGKGINFMKTTFEHDGVTYPAIKLTGKIHKNYELDTDIWEKIKSGEYKGLSFGGATKADRTPKVMKDGDVAYALTDLEHYEVAVCKDPAVPLALITDHNPLAKAMVPSVPRGDGKEIIKCDKFGCYVNKKEPLTDSEIIDDQEGKFNKNETESEQLAELDMVESAEKFDKIHPMKKGEDLSNADIVPATASQTVDAGGMGKTVKPIKTDNKIGEIKDGVDTKIPKIEGGIGKNDSPSSTGTALGSRMLGASDAHKQGSGENSLITTDTEGVNNPLNSDKKQVKRSFSDAAVNKVVGALLAGAGRAVAQTVASAVTSEPEDDVEKSGYQTEDGNNQLGGQAAPKEKLVSALGAQNKETTVNKD